MSSFISSLFQFFAHLGAVGLIGLGILDSSFLFMPLGNDLLVVGLTVQHHQRFLFYAAMAALGSTLGVLLLDIVLRRGGEEGLKKMMSPKRFDYVKKKLEANGAIALAVTALAPPPFPFTPVIGAAVALDYPRPKLLAVIAGARFIRFTIMGVLAIEFGTRILTIAKSPVFIGCVLAFVVICIAGSVISLYGWWKRSRTAR